MAHLGQLAEAVQELAVPEIVADLLAAARTRWLPDGGCHYADIPVDEIDDVAAETGFPTENVGFALVQVWGKIPAHFHEKSNTVAIAITDGEMWSAEKGDWVPFPKGRVAVNPIGTLHGFQKLKGQDELLIIVVSSPPLEDDDEHYL